MPKNGKNGKDPKNDAEKDRLKEVQEGTPARTRCPFGDAYEGTEPEVRGHILGSHFSKSPSAVLPTAPPAAAPGAPDLTDKVEVRRDTFDQILRKAAGVGPEAAFMDPAMAETIPDVNTLQKEDTRRAYNEATRLKYEKQALKEAAEIERISGGDVQLASMQREIEALKEANRLKDQEMFRAQMRSEQQVFMTNVNTSLARIEAAVNNGKSNNGNSQVAEILAVAHELRPVSELTLIKQAQDAGIVGRLDGAPTSELAARAQLALEKQRQEATARERKELRDAGTGDRLVQLANKAVEVIAEPISRAVGESIKTAALRPAVQGQPQPAQGPPPTREQRLAQLQQITHLIGEATAARQKIEADLGETVSIPVPSEVPTNGGVTPTDPFPGQGTIFRGRK